MNLQIPKTDINSRGNTCPIVSVNLNLVMLDNSTFTFPENCQKFFLDEK